MAQLASVSAWGAGGRPFESDHPDKKGGISQGILPYILYVLLNTYCLGKQKGYNKFNAPNTGQSHPEQNQFYNLVCLDLNYKIAANLKFSVHYYCEKLFKFVG